MDYVEKTWAWAPGDRLLKSATVDRLLDASRGLKFALAKRAFNPFPKPYSLGRSNRWLESEVVGWLQQELQGQATPNASGATNASASTSNRPMADLPRKDATKLDVQAAKALYERGRSLDSLCRELQVGKARLIKELRAAGTEMRKPGRRSVAAMRATTPNAFSVTPWELK